MTTSCYELERIGTVDCLAYKMWAVDWLDDRCTRLEADHGRTRLVGRSLPCWVDGPRSRLDEITTVGLENTDWIEIAAIGPTGGGS